MKSFNLFLAGVISAFWVATAAAAPEIAVDQPAFDFGPIQQGKKVEHIFTIKNRGDTPLAIKNVRPSCGCTAVSTTTSLIPPGKTAGIKASFNSANFSGAIHKTVSVDTNDPKTPATTLILKGTVVEEIQITPKQLNLGQIKINETTRAVIVISNRGSNPLRLAAIKSPLTQIAAVADKKILKPGESGKISVSVSPGSGDRLLSGYLSIATDSPARREILVPVYGTPVH